MALILTAGCGRDDRGTADRTDMPATTADRTADTDWMRDRDEYIARRENELDEIERRWDNYQGTASEKSRLAWNEVK
jgi:hypothetical protein